MALGLARIRLGSMLAGMTTPGGIFSTAAGTTRREAEEDGTELMSLLLVLVLFVT